MGSRLPSFENPPVIETVLGVQFDLIERMGNHHLGAYWGSLDHTEWAAVEDVLALDQVAESFGEASTGMPSFQFHDSPPHRFKIRSVSGDRMIQVQNGWFVYNWLAGGNGRPYPRYESVRPEFDAEWKRFIRFLKAKNLPTPVPNLWEVTYVNHLEKGGCWDDSTEWPGVLPLLLGDPTSAPFGRLDGCSGLWRFEIEPKRAHLHIQVSPALRTVGEPREVLVLKLTARGPINEEDGWNLNKGLNFGHEGIVQAFDAITSERAQQHWGRIDDDHG